MLPMAFIVSAQHAKVQTQEAEGCGLGLDVLRRMAGMGAWGIMGRGRGAWGLCPSFAVVGDRRGEHAHGIWNANFADRAIKSKKGFSLRCHQYKLFGNIHNHLIPLLSTRNNAIPRLADTSFDLAGRPSGGLCPISYQTGCFDCSQQNKASGCLDTRTRTRQA